MAHLIQPLDVDGSLLCVAYQGNRATEIINTEIVEIPTDLATIVIPHGQWEMELVGTASVFEVSFGVGCGSEVVIETNVSHPADEDWGVNVNFYLNGAEFDPPVGLELAWNTTDSDTTTLDISDIPCGNIITVVVAIEHTSEQPVSVSQSITSIT